MQCRGESVHVEIDNVLQTTTDNPTHTVISNHDHVFNLRALYGIATFKGFISTCELKAKYLLDWLRKASLRDKCLLGQMPALLLIKCKKII
jgi:hypothetical protein